MVLKLQKPNTEYDLAASSIYFHFVSIWILKGNTINNFEQLEIGFDFFLTGFDFSNCMSVVGMDQYGSHI